MELMTKGIIFYSNGIKEPIRSMVEQSLEVGLPIVKSYSRGRTYHDMVTQIIYCLEQARTDVVFFCEHDVIYNPSHFEFTPPQPDVFYYNSHVWRWDFPNERYVTYDHLISLSAMCCYRKLALAHYQARRDFIRRYPRRRGEPHWLRAMGYEPGTKSPHCGGFSDEKSEIWRSAKPLIDIRHDRCFSRRKVHLSEFKHLPTGWQETTRRPE